jgi:hypothetical protein
MHGLVSRGRSQIKKIMVLIHISALTDGTQGIKDRTLGRHGTDKKAQGYKQTKKTALAI